MWVNGTRGCKSQIVMYLLVKVGRLSLRRSFLRPFTSAAGQAILKRLCVEGAVAGASERIFQSLEPVSRSLAPY